METIKVLIIDDEVLARKRIRNLLSSHSDITIAGECANGLAALDAIHTQTPDLIFLDVQMPDLDGFGVLHRLDPASLPLVIFVTAYDHYALQAFEVHALDYLLKPFDDERFESALQQARQHLRRKQFDTVDERLQALLATFPRSSGPWPERLAVKSAGRIIFLNTADISWIEGAGVYVRLYSPGGTHLVRERMNTLEKQLSPQRFVRIHRSTIVNLDYIRELHPHDHGEYLVILKDGTELRLSRGYRNKLPAILGQF